MRLHKLTWSTPPQKNKCGNYSLTELKNESWAKYHAGVGVVLSPHNYVIPHAFSLTELCSNNVYEYNTFFIRMQLAEEIGVKNLEAYGDLKLIVNQVRKEYEVQHEDLVPYHNMTTTMAEKFENFYIDHVSR